MAGSIIVNKQAGIKKKKSLQRRVFAISLTGGLFLGIVSLMIGLGIYAFVLMDQYISRAFNLTTRVSAIAEEHVDIKALVSSVMDVYKDIPDDERSDPEDPSYLKRFAFIRDDEDYKNMIDILASHKDLADISDIYLCAYDRNSARIVYIADPETDPELYCPPGRWDTYGQNKVDKFLNWKGGNKLYAFGYEPGYGLLVTSGIPLGDEQGDVVGYILADIEIMSLIRGMGTFVICFTIALVLIMTVYITVILRVMKKKLIDPINRVSEAAKQYASDKLAGSDADEHFEGLGIDSGDEIEDLAHTMAAMEKDMGQYVRNLMQITKEKERIGVELNMAAGIQQSAIPGIFPAFPDRKEFDLYASMDPAKEVGGDFYDFFFIDDDHLCLLIADVSGKGVPASLFMMTTKIILNYHVKSGKPLAECMIEANDSICEKDISGMFVTVWIAVLDLTTGECVSVNAGHEHPAICHNGRFELDIYRHSPAVAAIEGIRYRERSFRLDPGDAIFVYTDGVPEATNADDEMFGSERMMNTLNKDPHASPKELLMQVRRAVDAFVGDAPQFDDLTMLAIRYNGNN